jgi:hypothetical protein
VFALRDPVRLGEVAFDGASGFRRRAIVGRSVPSPRLIHTVVPTAAAFAVSSRASHIRNGATAIALMSR